MSERTKYKTKQRDILLEYLKSRPGLHITAGNVCDYLRERGTPLGQATVYRQLESLVDEGIVGKYLIDANTPACFEYMGHESHAGGEQCFHCRCEKCGRLIHMHCDELSGIGEHLYEHHGFLLNPMRTVFYGLCEDCMKDVGNN